MIEIIVTASLNNIKLQARTLASNDAFNWNNTPITIRREARERIYGDIDRQISLGFGIDKLYKVDSAYAQVSVDGLTHRQEINW